MNENPVIELRHALRRLYDAEELVSMATKKEMQPPMGLIAHLSDAMQEAAKVLEKWP